MLLMLALLIAGFYIQRVLPEEITDTVYFRYGVYYFAYATIVILVLRLRMRGFIRHWSVLIIGGMFFGIISVIEFMDLFGYIPPFNLSYYADELLYKINPIVMPVMTIFYVSLGAAIGVTGTIKRG